MAHAAGSSPNAYVEQVVKFAPDPRGWAMFGALTRRAARDLNSRAVIDARTSTYGGWVATPQRFTGLASLIAGRQRPITDTNAQLVNQRSTQLPGMQAFYEKMRRQQA